MVRKNKEQSQQKQTRKTATHKKTQQTKEKLPVELSEAQTKKTTQKPAVKNEQKTMPLRKKATPPASQEKNMENPFGTTQWLREVRHYSTECLQVETFGKRVGCSWKKTLHQQVNYADEDLYLEAWTGDQKISQIKVNHISSRDFYLAYATQYVIRLVRRPKHRMQVTTTSHYMPTVTLNSETEERHRITWSNIDWAMVRREVCSLHHVNWDDAIDSVMVVQREPNSGMNEHEVLMIGPRDHCFVLGNMVSAQLAVAHRMNGQILKTLFSVQRIPPRDGVTMEEVQVETPVFQPFFHLRRVVVDCDRLDLQAIWDSDPKVWEIIEEKYVSAAGVAWDSVEVLLRLEYEEGGVWYEFQPDQKKTVVFTDNWYFENLPRGRTYQARLEFRCKKTKKFLAPTIISEKLPVPEENNKVVLMPIDNNRLFVYWHLNADQIREHICEKYKVDWSNVGTFIRVFHDHAAGVFHHPHLDGGFDMYSTDHYYIGVEADRVYRVDLVAVVNGQVEQIAPLSNPAATGRDGAGHNPVQYHIPDYRINHSTIRPIESAGRTSEFSIGQIIMHLHAHLPFIKDRVEYQTTGGEFWMPHGYPEEWFMSAAIETYVPLIEMMSNLVNEGVDFKMSMDISPPLVGMMQHPTIKDEFLRYVDALIALARSEIDRTTREQPFYNHTAWMHLERFQRCKETFLMNDGDLTKAFKYFQDIGKLEIIPCVGTHPFLPFYTKYPETIRAQVEAARGDYERVFGRAPNGVWLPECAYTPGLEKFLEDAQIRYFFSETHTVCHADCGVEFGVHAPVYIKGSSVAVFPRDPETGRQVWSGEQGYPGDPDYMEFFYKGGPLRYNRITSRTSNYKEPYNREWAMQKAADHAQHFMDCRNFRFQHIREWFWKKPLVVAAYDAELFGHHWFEGPDFLYFFFKKIYYNQNQTELTTPSHYLASYPHNQQVFPNTSSWGDQGTFGKWMYGSVSWMYRYAHEAVEEMVRLANHARDHAPVGDVAMAILKQAAREILVSQNSDAGFVISNDMFIDRMRFMFLNHLNNFYMLAQMYWDVIAGHQIDEVALRQVELEDPLFPNIDPLTFCFRE